MQKELSEIVANAFHSEGDEYAWRRENVVDAIAALANNDYAILGGEAWIVRDGQILAALPLLSGENAIFCWSTKDKSDTETWSDFVHRSAKDAVRVIESLEPEEILPQFVDKLYFNLTFIDEQNY